MKPANLYWAAALIVASLISFWLGRAQTVELRARISQLEQETLALKRQVDSLGTAQQLDMTANERAAIRALRSIVTAIIAHMAEKGTGYPATLEELGPNGLRLLDQRLSAGQSAGYRIIYKPQAPENGASAITAFELSARPERIGETGVRSFFADESGTVRHTSEARAATKADPPL